MNSPDTSSMKKAVMSKPFDALLLVSFGGPECREDVIPFLENVTRGKNVPRERLLEVAEHYYHFGGASPINQQNRELMAALGAELAEHGRRLPIYWGNRNWHPMLPDAIRQMRDDGVRRALAFVTSAFSSYSGCRQYREDIERARAEVGSAAPLVEKLRPFFNHPGFIEAVVDRVQEALESVSRRSPCPDATCLYGPQHPHCNVERLPLCRATARVMLVGCRSRRTIAVDINLPKPQWIAESALAGTRYLRLAT